MSYHQVIDERSRAFGKAIALRLPDEPELIERARTNLHRWLLTCSSGVQPALQEWMTVLDGPLDRVIDVLTNSDDRSTRLRQSSPFAGMLSKAQRNEIIQQFARHEPPAT